MPVELELAKDAGIEEARVPVNRVDAEPRQELLRGGRASDRRSGLDDEHAPRPPPARHRGGHQLLRTRAEDDHVVAHRPPSASTAFAARCPLAPMIPPPGCVPDPHW